jgi:hypothetical protein
MWYKSTYNTKKNLFCEQNLIFIKIEKIYSINVYGVQLNELQL